MTAAQISCIKIDFDIKDSFNSIFILSLILQSWIPFSRKKIFEIFEKKNRSKENDGE